MAKNIKNNKLIQKNSLSVPDLVQDEIITRKRGRPKGSKNTVKTSRPDSTVQTNPGENTKYISHDLILYRLPAIDINDSKAVKERIEFYFELCSKDDIKPSIASLALAFNVSRFTLYDWLNGRNESIKNTESILTLKTAYNFINSLYEHYMNNGKINPVAGIFLMKNNMGYKDTTDHVIIANQDNNDSVTDISNRANLLEE